ncbi:MAG TPA: cob(I)yrinic acid a,c-diamide adenosyltransferase [Miltoncostaeaceae bacterium]|nr:cob(I)yrinic acid a,c-diamide adenosyltransferase [Miltoncostaeaceae bacterium]
MVRLTRIYTRLGDEGDTHLGDMSRARKTSPRVVAYGDVDELNSALGVARAEGLPGAVDGWLRVIQNDLFDVGADLCVPGGQGEGARLRVTGAQVERLEGWCDEVNETLEPLTSFVLPAGTRAAAALHLARAICRRAERSAVALADAEPVTPEALAYLNRLSDLLFILARAANREEARGDVLWTPGEGRSEG